MSPSLLLKMTSRTLPHPFLYHHPRLNHSHLLPRLLQSLLVCLIVSPTLSLQSVFKLAARKILWNTLDHINPLLKTFQRLALPGLLAETESQSLSSIFYFLPQTASYPPHPRSQYFSLCFIHTDLAIHISQVHFNLSIFFLTPTFTWSDLLPDNLLAPSFPSGLVS
jgi:hypothetical protein